MHAVLIPHPSSPAGPIERLTVEVERQGESLWLRFVVQGEVDQVAWPAPATPGRADALWRRTCFEAFVATDAGYVEYNLSPSGQWATYGFDAYREGMRPAPQAAAVLSLEGGDETTLLEARIDLPADAGRLGLSAVIETTEGVCAYWALAHPSDKPDFHHPETMTLALPAAEPL